MPRSLIVSLVFVVALGPWLLADGLFVHSGQDQAHWAKSSGFLQGSFFWAVFVLAIAVAWFSFSRLIPRGSVIAVAGSVAAFLIGAVVFGYVWYVMVFFVHTLVFGGSI